MQSQRKTYLDLLRIVAILLVIFNHMPGYSEYYYHTDLKFGIYVIPAIITRINVPLFWMISGALLLRKTESLSQVFQHRISRIALTIFLSGGILYLLKNFSTLNITDFIQKLLSNGIEESYWFLYTYLGILFLLPYLQRIAQHFSKKDFLYFLVLHAAFHSILPMLNYILQCKYGTSVSIRLSLPLITENAFFFFFMGYYLENVFDISKLCLFKLTKIIAGMTFCVAISAAFIYHQGITTGFSQSYLSLFDYIIAITIFISTKYLFTQSKTLHNFSFANKMISCIGSLTFGIYLLDPILKHFFYKAFENALEPSLPTFICSIVWTLLSALVCGSLSFFLKKLPGFRFIL